MFIFNNIHYNDRDFMYYLSILTWKHIEMNIVIIFKTFFWFFAVKYIGWLVMNKEIKVLDDGC